MKFQTSDLVTKPLLMSADDKRRRVGLIGSWPFLDAFAIFCLFMAAPGDIEVAVGLMVLYWRRSSLKLALHLAAAFVSGLLIYSGVNVWSYIYTLCAALLASRGSGSSNWLINVVFLYVGTTALRLLGRLSFDHELHVGVEVILGQILCALAHELLDIRTESDEPPKKGRKLAVMKSRQPMWTFIALALSKRKKKDVYEPIVVRYVEDRIIGLETEALPVLVNDVAWSQTHHLQGVLLIYGLEPSTNYKIQVGESVVECLTANQRSESPSWTAEEIIAAAEIALNEAKTKLRKSKRDQAKKLATIRQEIVALNDRQDSTAKADERARRKLLSLQDQVRQLEEDTKELQAREKELNDRRPEAKAAFAVREREWNDKRLEAEKVREELQKVSSEHSAQVRELNASIAELEARELTLKAKADSLAQEATEISQSTELAVKALIDSRAEAREAKRRRRARQEEELQASIDKLKRGVADMEQRALLVTQAAGKWSTDWS